MTNPWAQPGPAQPASVPFPPPQPTVIGQQPSYPPAQAGQDEFGAPAPQSDRPRVIDLQGRLIIWRPLRLEEGIATRFKDNAGNAVVQDRMTVDVIVLDGGTLAYGGKPEDPDEPTPHTKSHEVPWCIERMYISQKGLVSQLRDAYRAKMTGQGQAMVLGRLVKGQKTEANRRAPWLISNQLTEQDKQMARAWLAANRTDAFASPSAG